MALHHGAYSLALVLTVETDFGYICTRSSTHTVNLPLLPADTAKGAYGPQNRAEKTSLGP